MTRAATEELDGRGPDRACLGEQGLQDVRRGRVRSLGERAVLPVARRRSVDGSADPEVVNVPRGSRKDARDAVLAAKERRGRLGGADRLQSRADPLPPRGGDGVASRRAGDRPGARRAGRGPGTARGRGRRRSRRLLRRLLRQVPGARGFAQPGRRAALRLQLCPSRWASWPSSRPSGRRCSASCRPCCRSSREATRASSWPGAKTRARRSSGASASRPAISRVGVVNVLTGAGERDGAAPRRSTAR